jgi:hypothetical protein
MFSKLYKSLASITMSEKQADSFLLFEKEQPFNDLYNAGMAISQTPDSGIKRRARFYNLISFLKQTSNLDGGIVECGCWKGLSSYLMTAFIKDTQSEFKGERYHIFDSFEGLSHPTSKDVIDYKLVDKKGDRKGSFFKGAGAYNASLVDVRNVLKDFPSITYYQGWIPQILPEFSAEKLKFVHIDLDLYEPIIGALEFFYPMLVSGGIVVCDDYGSLYWPGAKKAVEEFAQKHSVKFISLSTGQAIFIKE